MMHRPTFNYRPGMYNQMNKQNCASNHVASNIIKTENGFDIQIAVPGIDKENIKLFIKDDILTVEGKTDNTENKVKYNLRQFDFSNFKKSFEISDNIDHENIEAAYANGILTIKLLKKEMAEAEMERKIEVK